jgi:hypothetical protein
VAPEAELPRLPGEDRQPRPRGSTRRRLPKPLKKLAPAPKESADGEPSPPRTTLSRRQTQGIVVAACATVLVAVGVLAIAGVFSSGSEGSTTTTTSDTNPATPPSGTVQGYPLLPIAAANNKGQGAKLDSNGNFEDSIPIPTAVQSILPNVQAVAITLANNTKVAKSIQTAVQNKQAILTVEGTTDFIGVVGAKKGKVFPIQLTAGKNVKGSGTAALGVTNKQPFFQVKMTGLAQPPNGSSYIIWLVVGTAQKQQ